MSFSFHFFGDKDHVADRVRSYRASGDASQVDAVKALVAEIVEKAPDDTVLSVEANGHHDYTSDDRANANIDLKIRLKSKASVW